MFNKLVLAVGITLTVNVFIGINEPSPGVSEETTIAQPQHQTSVQVSRNVQNSQDLTETESVKTSN